MARITAAGLVALPVSIFWTLPDPWWLFLPPEIASAEAILWDGYHRINTFGPTASVIDVTFEPTRGGSVD